VSLARNDPRHGTMNGYSNHGCRCNGCRIANTAYYRAHRQGGYRQDACPTCGKPKRVIARQCRGCENAEREAPHGTESRYQRCWCDECRQAASDARRRRRPSKSSNSPWCSSTRPFMCATPA
jgi:hypothetical protein